MDDVRYARTAEGTHIAYRVLAATSDAGPGGGLDIVMVSGGLIPMEMFEDDPCFVRMLDGLRANRPRS